MTGHLVLPFQSGSVQARPPDAEDDRQVGALDGAVAEVAGAVRTTSAGSIDAVFGIA